MITSPSLAFIDKCVPKKYQGIAVLIALTIIGTNFITTCINTDNSSNKEIKETLKELNNKVDKLNIRLNVIDSTTTVTKYAVIFINEVQNTQFTDICDIMGRGFTITKEELISLHKDQYGEINTRFGDLNAYIKAIVKKDSNIANKYIPITNNK